MTYQIKVTPNSKNMEVIEEKGSLRIKVDAPPVEGKANKRLIEILAGYFNVSPSRVRIVSGHTSRNKVIEVL
ncbi:MAG: DUF167 domain-containing protein [Patescibacteria group bacterium]